MKKAKQERFESEYQIYNRKDLLLEDIRRRRDDMNLIFE